MDLSVTASPRVVQKDARVRALEYPVEMTATVEQEETLVRIV